MSTDVNPLGSEESSAGIITRRSQRIFLIAIALGFLLRLISVVYGDISSGGDGMWRLAFAVDWAEKPYYHGLYEIWPPLHFYFLGALIWLWDEPIILAKLVNFVLGMGTLVILRSTIRPLFGDLVAAISVLLLAVYWTHIWLTSSYWVEIPFIFLVFLAVHRTIRTAQTSSRRDAFLAGIYLALAILLRHEGSLLLVVFLIWYALNIRERVLILIFAAVPAYAAAGEFIEPWLNHGSFFEFASLVRNMKAEENALQGYTLRDCLYLWVLMPMSVPSMFVVVPGLYGLWMARRRIRYDLFAWMFIAQVGFYLTMTLTSAWRPQLRYVLLCFVNLIPYSAVAWAAMMRRFSPAPVLAGLLLATMATQSAAWWVGRNNRLPMGWLPLQAQTTAQKALDDWLAKVKQSDPDEIRMVSFVQGSIREPWSMVHGFLVNRIPLRMFRSTEMYVAEIPDIRRGELPPQAYTVDIILIDPKADFYPEVLRAVRNRHPYAQVAEIHPHINGLLLSQEAVAVVSGSDPPSGPSAREGPDH
ncbi:MAG TPA: glycosyltransferase family 39 protein [Blastocatellia bacterium]|nr:glycosyltransferase family 39 protein [Blastocatellia bacterium]